MGGERGRDGKGRRERVGREGGRWDMNLGIRGHKTVSGTCEPV